MNDVTNPLISVIMPIYNVESYLERSVQSVQQQDYQNLEIILVDDGSTDKSGLLCDKVAEQDNRIKVIHKKNGGLSDARNVGIRSSRGAYITLVDSDDEIDHDCISYLYSLIERYHCPMSLCTHRIYYERSKKMLNSAIVKNAKWMLKLVSGKCVTTTRLIPQRGESYIIEICFPKLSTLLEKSLKISALHISCLSKVKLLPADLIQNTHITLEKILLRRARLIRLN